MPTQPKLSICISTFNRADFIGETLESIVSQVTDYCEVIVSDNASQDDTEAVVTEYVNRCERLRYVRHDTDCGVDRNYDRTVELACGEYCWLLSDDDPLKPGAVAALLNALVQDFSLVLVNSEARDISLSRIIQPRCHEIDADRVYEPEEMDCLFADIAPYLNYISGYVIKRTIWLERERERYYGSWFIFVGVVFQKRLPGKTLVMAEPLLCCRFGNLSTASSDAFRIFVINFSSLVWSLDISDVAKVKCIPREPWRNLPLLLYLRAIAVYSISDYRRCVQPKLRSTRERLVPFLIAVTPGAFVNTICMVYFSWARQRLMLSYLRESRFHMRNWLISKKPVSRSKHQVDSAGG